MMVLGNISTKAPVARHNEDSSGRLTLVNAIHLVHLNTLLQDVRPLLPTAIRVPCSTAARTP